MWERMIQTLKEAMFAILKDWILTDFQILTLFSEVKNIINNCPLTYLSEGHDMKTLEMLVAWMFAFFDSLIKMDSAIGTN